jgi:hypothetical protein
MRSAHGVSSAEFGVKLAEILSAPRENVELTWVAFGGAYDLAYLVRMLDGGQPLPETRQGFMERVRDLLGGRVFDAKFMAENCGRADLRGVGLRSVAANLGAAMAAEDLPWPVARRHEERHRLPYTYDLEIARPLPGHCRWLRGNNQRPTVILRFFLCSRDYKQKKKKKRKNKKKEK